MQENLCAFADRPVAFFARYVRLHRWTHAVILSSVALAVLCSVVAQYGVKFLVDTLSQPARDATLVWLAFAILVTLIAADNLLWRLAGWVGHSTFVAVTGDVRRDLFRHLTGHAPSYFASRSPGTLTSRITATSNALFTVENMLVWNVLPPCMATVCAIALVATVSWGMAASLVVVGGLVVVVMFRRAAAGKPLHHEFANRAAAVDGEMTDVVGNMAIVKAFGGLLREHRRFDAKVEQEMAARRRSLFYLERLRIMHALVTVVLTVALLAWAIVLWQRGAATTGDVILVCTLGLSVLHATRDLAVAPRRCHAAHGAVRRGAVDAARSPPAVRPPGRARPQASWRQRDIRGRDVRLSRLPDDLRGPRASTSARASASVSSAPPAAASPRSSPSLQRFYDIQSGAS